MRHDQAGDGQMRPELPSNLNDRHRPRYHFLPPANWMNDPNGLLQWRGRYHLFYQYNPHGPFWGTIHWGHAVSTDLVHWTHLPIALAPTSGGPDEGGCYSGCAVVHNGVPAIIYTGVRGAEQRPCLAVSHDDELLNWQKYPGNPVIAAPPAGLAPLIFRDHSVWNEGGTWYQAVGAGIPGVGGAALLYRSDELIRWDYLQPLCVGDVSRTAPVWTGLAWECPCFFALDGRHVLVVSAWDGWPRQVVAMVGAYQDHRFVPWSEALVDGGDSFYAPQVFDDRGRRVMFGWLRERRSEQAQRAAGWSGVMSLPRILAVLDDGTLAQVPAPELTVLRRRHVRIGAGTILPANSGILDGMRGDTLELLAEFASGDAVVGLKVRCSPDGAEETLIAYDRAARRLEIDIRRSSHAAEATGEVLSFPLDLAPAEPMRLRVFLDRSVVEVFANDRACLTARIYPARVDSLGVGLVAQDGADRLLSLDAWEMASIW